MPGFSFLSTLAAGLAAWSIRRLSTSRTWALAAAGLVVVAVGVGADSDVITVIGVFVVAVAVGTLLGRVVPASARAVFFTLVVLSVVDLVWIASGGGAGDGWVGDVATVSLRFGDAVSSIGTLDLLIAAGLTTHWFRRGASVRLAVAPGPIGMAISNVFVAVTGATNLALVPFLLLGWLVTEAWYRRQKPMSVSPGSTSPDS